MYAGRPFQCNMNSGCIEIELVVIVLGVKLGQRTVHLKLPASLQASGKASKLHAPG